MESEEITKLVDGIYKNILDKFNPGARQLINAGKAYLKALHGAAAASRLYVEAITKLARQAQQGSTWGGSADVGSALMQIVEVYKEIQAQQMNILKAFYVDLLVPLETNLEKDTKVVQSEQKKFLQQHKQRHETYSKAAATMKKQRKKTKGSSSSSSAAAKTGLALDKELKNMQIMEEEKSKLDGFCEQSLKTAITQERRRYGFVLERQCSLAKHYLAYHGQGHALFQRHLEDWQEVARTREFLPEAVDTMFANRLSQVNFWQEDDEDDIYSQPSRGKSGSNIEADRLSLTSQLRKTKSMDASCLELRSMNEVVSTNESGARNRGSTAGVTGMDLSGSRPTLLGSLSRAKSEYNLTASTHSLVHEPDTPPARPKSMAVPEVHGGTGRRVNSGLRSRTEEDVTVDTSGGGQVARALYAYLSSGENQLSFLEGDLISLMGERNKGWQFGENLRTRRSGWFPLAYTEVVLSSADGDEDIDDDCLRGLEDDVDDDDNEDGGGDEDRVAGSPGQPNRPSRRRNRSQGTLPHQRHHHRMSSVDTAVIGGVSNGGTGKSLGLLSPTSAISAANPSIASSNSNRPAAPKPPPPPPVVSAMPNNFGDTVLQRVTGLDKIRLATTSTANEGGTGIPLPPLPPNYSNPHQTFQGRGPLRSHPRTPHGMHPHVPPPPPPPPPPGHAPTAFSSLPPFTSFSSPFSASSTSSSSSSSSTASSHSQRTPPTNNTFGKLRTSAAGTPVSVPVIPGTVGIGNASLHSSNDSGFSNEGLPPPQPEADYSDDDSPRNSAANHETPGNLSSVVRGWLLYKSALELWEDVNNQAMEDEAKEKESKEVVAATLGRQGGGGALQQLHRRTSFSADHLLSSQDGTDKEFAGGKKANGKSGSLVKRTLSFWKIRSALTLKRNYNKERKQLSSFQEKEVQTEPMNQLWRHDSVVKLAAAVEEDNERKPPEGNESTDRHQKSNKTNSMSSLSSSVMTEGTVRNLKGDVETFSWIAVDGYTTQSKKSEINDSEEKIVEGSITTSHVSSRQDAYHLNVEHKDTGIPQRNGSGSDASRAPSQNRRKHPPLPPPPPPPLPTPPPLPKGHPTLDLDGKGSERAKSVIEVQKQKKKIKGSLRISTSSRSTTQYHLLHYGERIHARLYRPERGSRFDQKSEASGNMCGPWYDLWGVDQSVARGKHMPIEQK
ncbi:uncharacterized protein LOC124153533 [Ischnura elegans]|uniref:uncharacterized protein LOC124153533 n=1 Tax=Ischnura elegans TaxID=197161 RepID=UPI001ED8B655|nr:uncharacterized protein LOC124153533 [Ischnura elegans]